LLCGLTPYHIRLLIDDPWEGGHGLSMDEVKRLTLDQIFLILCSRKELQFRKKHCSSDMVVAKADAGGLIQGRTIDGKPMLATIEPKSVVQKLREAKEARKEQAPRRRRRK
jgi:hypothetical protein